MHAERVTLTRHARASLPERARLATTVVGLMVAAGAVSTLLQWPVWHLSPLLATINTLLAVGHAAVAPLLREAGAGMPRRIVPLTFGLAGVCRSGSWKARATWVARSAMRVVRVSEPSTVTRPRLGRSRPLKCRTSVVLPEPF